MPIKMFVNGIDMSTYNCTLLTREVQPSEVMTFSDWLPKSLDPLYTGKKVKYLTIKCQTLVEGTSDEACLTSISNIVLLMTKCILKFEDINLYYDCTIETPETTRLDEGIYALVFEAKASGACMPEVSQTFTEKVKTLTVAGNLDISAILTITPAIGLGSVLITGFGRDITIHNLSANVPIVIDGTACLVTANSVNKFADVDMWAFPSLKPGSNPITINQNGITWNVKYKPKFM